MCSAEIVTGMPRTRRISVRVGQRREARPCTSPWRKLDSCSLEERARDDIADTVDRRVAELAREFLTASIKDAWRFATRRALARARRRDRVRSDNDAVASRAGQVLTGRRAPRGTRPAMTWTRRDVSGAVVSPRRAQRGGPPRSPPVSPPGPDKEGQSSDEPRALSRSSSRRCTMLGLRLPASENARYVTLTGPMEGATATRRLLMLLTLFLPTSRGRTSRRRPTGSCRAACRRRRARRGW